MELEASDVAFPAVVAIAAVAVFVVLVAVAFPNAGGAVPPTGTSQPSSTGGQYAPPGMAGAHWHASKIVGIAKQVQTRGKGAESASSMAAALRSSGLRG